VSSTTVARTLASIAWAALVSWPMPSPVHAEESATVEELQKEIEELKKVSDAQLRALKAMFIRLQRLERQAAAGKPPEKPKPAPIAKQKPPKDKARVVAKPPAVRPEIAKPTAPEPEPVEERVKIAKPAAPEPKPEEEKVVKKARPSRGVEAVVDEVHGTFLPGFTFDPGITYSHSDRRAVTLRGFLALDAIFLGRISVDDVDTDVVRVDMGGRYGITDRHTLRFNAPFLWRKTTYRENQAGGAERAAETSVSASGELGDVSFGLDWQVHPESRRWPDIVWGIDGTAPTGKDPFGIDIESIPGTGLRVPKDVPTGSGVWSASTGFSFLKTIDPAVLIANVRYFHNFEKDVNDLGTAEDQPNISGSVDLGDAVQFGLGTALALNERTSLSLQYQQRFSEKARTRVDGGDWQKVSGSDINAGTFNVGLTFALTDRLSILSNLGIGLTNDAPDVQFGMRFPYSFR